MTPARPRPVVLIAEELAPSVLAVLGDGFDVRHVDGADRAALLPALADADAVLIRSATQVDAQALSAAPRLKVVARAGIGLDNVDVAAATARGVMVVNAPQSNVVSAAEQAVTLLLAFFIYLWFSYRLSNSSDDLFAAINEIRFPRTSAAATVATIKPRLRQFLEPEIREGLVSVRDEADRSTVILRGDGLFDPAATVVKPRYVQVIHRVAAALDEVPGKVIVNGYTDNLPIRTARFPSNWNLSQERAQAVSQMLGGSLRDRQRLHAEGRADSDPVAPNNTAEGRALNRRVEIVLLVAPQQRDQQLQALPAAPETRN